MMTNSILNVSGPLEDYKEKWEKLLYMTNPSLFDNGSVHAIHIGARDHAPGMSRGGYKIDPSYANRNAIYLELPEKMFLNKVIADLENRNPTTMARVADSVAAYANTRVADLVSKGRTLEEAQAVVRDSMETIGYFDQKSGKFIAEPIIKGVNDSMLSGMTTPMWNVSQIPKVFKQPYLKGEAERLVSKMGAPNVWADIIQIFLASYEGAARLSNVASAGLEWNTTIGPKRKTGTMLSEMVNIVVDYENQSPNELMIAGQGSWLVQNTFGDMEVFVALMQDILMNTLIYFGHDETGFEGLTQIAIRDNCYTQYPSNRPTAQYLWENDGVGGGSGPVNDSVGADLLLMLNHFIADKMEQLHFLPTKVKINCGTDLYKALKFSMLNKQFNQNNPLSIIHTAFEAGNKIVGTMATNSGDNLSRTFEICPDIMLNPETPFNPTDEDLMFITFPNLQSALEVNNVLSDVVMMPCLIERMILPSAPQVRNGMVRSALKRVGSLLCPIRQTVHVLTGMGRNSRYTP
jgi:hypothetical protein